jgi:hypothetical protein
MRTWITALAVCALVACSHHGADEDETGATLSIEPPTAELLILDGVAAHQNYTATLKFPDGHTKDVTAQTSFIVDSSYGAFTMNDLAVTTAGKTSAFGTYVDKMASAQVIVRLKSTRVDPALAPNTPDLFMGAEDVARAPNVIYPAPDVIIPRNLGDFETHWTDGSGNDIFEVSLRTEFADVRVYVPGGNGSPAAGPMASFVSFRASEWIAAVGLETSVQYQVRGIQSTNPTGPVGAGPVRKAQLSNEQMEGGLYYWAATSTSGAYGIFRHDMNKPGLPAEEFMTTNQTAGRCVACHALSRDGTKMAITYDGGGGAATIVDVATSAAVPSAAAWNFGTFSPDGSQLISVEQGVMVVRDSATQTPIVTMPSTGFVSHPDLSADGHSLVYTRSMPGSDWSFNSGTIYTRSYDPTTHVFGAEVPLVVDGVNNFYPTWSPDGKWILFNRSDSGTSYNNANASLWVIKSDGTAPAIQLMTANQGLGLTNSWGRWAPFAQTVGANHEPLFWITVSSTRNFGVRLFGAARPQLWMTPFFPERAALNQEPSAPAFWLPFQNIVSNNHIAQWTERVVIQ